MPRIDERALGTDDYTDKLRAQGIVARALDNGGYFLHIHSSVKPTYSPEITEALENLRATALAIQSGKIATLGN